MGNECMRDLLQRFSEKKHAFVETPEKEEVELNLGLSLGGCFGVEPNEKTSLLRSSSNACYTTSGFREDGLFSLTRTSSLPVENEVETRKRKGLETVRHMVGMKKRSEKERCSRDENDVKSESLIPLGPVHWCFGSQGMEDGGNLGTLSQGLGGSSQGSGSYGVSESENQQNQGSNNNSGSTSPASVLSLPEQSEHKPTLVPCSKPIQKSDTSGVTAKTPLDKHKVMNSCRMESEMKVMQEMPCVFTKGDGPNGKRIEGLLYQYRSGKEVRIVCVCHGSCLTPAEFVKHAGGNDVTHPLRHIVVVPSPPSVV
ncbi:hypothetical protein IFM89_004627 [Coptis chinensis]|uniref:Ninja-family protein n=1 Tax=Coptis chinensis TaxID=261450 RepID=A0A835H4S1_9MAGN|nr:hypothetical protein IFM89_004627 [Coptis chinensis]